METSPKGRSPEPVEPVETAPETEGEAERRWAPWLRDFEGFDPGFFGWDQLQAVDLLYIPNCSIAIDEGQTNPVGSLHIGAKEWSMSTSRGLFCCSKLPVVSHSNLRFCRHRWKFATSEPFFLEGHGNMVQG